MNPQFSSNLGAAAASAANLGGSPNGNSDQMQHLQNLAQIQFAANNTANATKPFSQDASTTAANAAASLTANQQIADNQEKAAATDAVAKEKFQDAMTNPANFKRTVAQDGGYNFFAPDGTPISVSQYSQATGKQIPEALKGSQNEQDNAFTNDYKALIDYGKALSGDQTALDKFRNSPEGKAFTANPNNTNKTYAEIVNDFSKYHSDYMQPKQLNTLNPIADNGTNMSNVIGTGSGSTWLQDLLQGTRQGVVYR